MQTSIDKDTAALTVGLANIHTWLFVPATKIERVAKAFDSGADAVIVDLEDAVAQADKAQARDALQQYYDSADYQPVWVRINQAGSTGYAEDIKLCEQLPNLAGIILPKAEQAADIEYIHHLSCLSIIALIESAVGLHNLDNMAGASGLVAFSYGFLDLCNDLRVQVGTAAADIIANQIRYQLLISSKVHQLSAPIDTVYPEFNDSEGLSQRVQLWSQIGMSGMLCIHPKQVATVKESLRPSDADIEFAKRVIAEYESTGKAVFKVEDNMIDAPVIKRCYQLLSR
ncbi:MULTISPECIES: HpcH/HpaI aldolase/citrate lyase family protein [unclassified Psychrobacter]|uniref:HpcH/HpaI aldolase/citrate lyase family protein n=1 Tax=unclassified Psychrobacter TaxID=196806 RepID=UPI0026008EBC|nr:MULTISPECIES: CoA ester lyase [unclassified Psychrobacter]